MKSVFPEHNFSSYNEYWDLFEVYCTAIHYDRNSGTYVVPTDTVTAAAPVMMLEGALKKEMKRDFLAERDRDLVNYTWLLAGSEHRVYWLMDATGAVKLSA